MAVRSGEDVCFDRQWFGDDAAVDFPSTDGAIARIRAGFLVDERTPALRASLQVGRDDAAWGFSFWHGTCSIGPTIRCIAPARLPRTLGRVRLLPLSRRFIATPP